MKNVFTQNKLATLLVVIVVILGVVIGVLATQLSSGETQTIIVKESEDTQEKVEEESDEIKEKMEAEKKALGRVRKKNNELQEKVKEENRRLKKNLKEKLKKSLDTGKVEKNLMIYKKNWQKESGIKETVRRIFQGTRKREEMQRQMEDLQETAKATAEIIRTTRR